MKTAFHPGLSRAAVAVPFLSFLTPFATATVTVDGTLDAANETEYAEVAVQSNTTGWGASNALANLHAGQTEQLLHLFLGGRVADNAIILFIDSKFGGISRISNTLIASGGYESDLNNMGVNDSTGLTFEAGFEPDYAIRVYGNGADAYASLFDLTRRFRYDLGKVDATTASHGVVDELRVAWADVGADSSSYPDAVSGMEMSLNLALLGVDEGIQDVKVMALLVNNSSSWGSNQTLGSLDGTDDIGGALNTFSFETETGDQTLTISVDRPELDPSGDEDGDGITNEEDFEPIDQTRDVTFSVDMNVEAAKGTFAPGSNVHAQFFSGSESPLSTVPLSDPDGDLIYTGSLILTTGFEGDSFGTYKFITDDPSNPNGGYEYGLDRTFELGAPEVEQVLPTAFFSGATTLSYSDWANANAGGEGPTEDHDKDGMPNGVEHFMGETGSSFTPNPPIVNGAVTWPRGPYSGNSFRISLSNDLVNWTDVTGDAETSDSAVVSYMLPGADPKEFVRLEAIEP